MKEGKLENLHRVLILAVAAIIISLHAGSPAAMQGDGRIRTAAEKTTMTEGSVSGKKGAMDKIEVAAGREFSLTLASNATTGYHWELAAALDEAVVKLVNSTYQAPTTDLLGAGGKEIWTFRAVAPGQTTIKLKYVRPWEKDQPPADTASYQVTVR